MGLIVGLKSGCDVLVRSRTPLFKIVEFVILIDGPPHSSIHAIGSTVEVLAASAAPADLDPLRSRVEGLTAQLEAIRRLDDFMQHRPMPFRLWLRQIAYDRLVMLRRYHVGAARRPYGLCRVIVQVGLK